MEAPRRITSGEVRFRSAEDLYTVSEYTCPMHPDVRRVRPGSCPKCGMALEPAAPVLTEATTEYVCPMHPEIVRPEPGNCPICGMALEPRLGGPEEVENPEWLRKEDDNARTNYYFC